MTAKTLNPEPSRDDRHRGEGDGSTVVEAPQATKPKSLRYKIGLVLLILYPFFYLALPAAPLLPVSGAAQATIAGAVVATGEVLLLVAIALMGKEGYQAMKAKIKGGMSRRREK